MRRVPHDAQFATISNGLDPNDANRSGSAIEEYLDRETAMARIEENIEIAMQMVLYDWTRFQAARGVAGGKGNAMSVQPTGGARGRKALGGRLRKGTIR